MADQRVFGGARRPLARWVTLIAATGAFLLVLAGMALADNVQNDVVVPPDVLTVVQGSTASTNYQITATSGDGQAGCNASDGSPATVNISGLPTGVSYSPNPLQFSQCHNPSTDAGKILVTFTASATATPGDYPISHSVSDAGPGTYNTAPAAFTLRVEGASAPDGDGDGVPDADDNCPSVANADQADADSDGLGNACDSNSYAPQGGTAAADANGDEGDTLTTGGSFTDQDGNGTLTISKVSGDGNFSPTGGGNWSWSLPTNDNGSGSVTVQASDGEHAAATDTFDWSAANVAPSVNASFASPVSCGANNATLTVNFTDPGTADTHVAYIDWDGDGTADETLDPATSGFSRSHTYGAGYHNAKVTVTDDDGDSGQDNSNALTVNYNTSGILQPVNWTQAQNDPSIFKYGSTIPVKVRFTDCDGSVASNLSVKVEILKISGTTPPTGENEAITNTNSPDSGGYMRWDGTQYIYNLNTKSLSDSSATYKITLTVVSTTQAVTTNFGTRPR